MKNNRVAAVVLAAGQGKRMKSDMPKVLHRACGWPLVRHVLSELDLLGCAEVVVVIGHGAEEVRLECGSGYTYALQQQQLGTGDAVRAALEVMGPGPAEVLVVPGDSPLITAGTLERLIELRREAGVSAALLSATLEDPTGYGRVIRADDGGVLRIVEEADADSRERAVREVNACTYVFDRAALEQSVGALENDNAQKEYYLTAAVAPLVASGQGVAAFEGPAEEAMGVNNRFQLAEAEAVLRRRIAMELADGGVSVVDPATTYLERGVVIEEGTLIMPVVFINGNCRVGKDCRIGPCTSIEDSTLGPGTGVEFSRVQGCEIGAGVQVGPFSRLRPGCRIHDGARVGSFVELKNSEVGQDSKVPHLSYVGDATIGKSVNIGAGSITCNYDGKNKHHTSIRDGAFIGSDTMLIAPVEVGEGAVTAAGSAVYRDVPAGSLGVERSEQVNVPGYRSRRDERDE